jgi:hypothetical protein
MLVDETAWTAQVRVTLDIAGLQNTEVLSGHVMVLGAATAVESADPA